MISRSHGVTERNDNETGTLIVDRAVHLHQDLGPGLPETGYQVTLAAELRKRGLSVQRQVHFDRIGWGQGSMNDYEPT